MTAIRYDRERLVDVLVHHWPTQNNGCLCGWAELGRSHPEHVATVYEQAVTEAAPTELVLREGDATCWFCIGQACAKCGPNPDPPCDHDVIDRHGEQECDDLVPRAIT